MSSTAWQLVGWLANRRNAVRPQSPVEEEVTALFVELSVPLLRYLHNLGLPVADGKDIVQDTFLSLFYHLRKDKPRDNLSGWTFRVGRNLARVRRNGRDPVAAGENAAEIACPDVGFNPQEQAASCLFHSMFVKDCPWE